MATTINKAPRARRETMTAGQRHDLEVLAIVTARFAIRNERMARGLEHGFRSLSPEQPLAPELELSESRR